MTRASGFDVRPRRPVLATAILFLAVTVAASAFAHLFKWTLHEVIRFYSDRSSSTDASSSLRPVVLFAIATGSVIVAAGIGHRVHRIWGKRVGIEAVAASARGEGRSISFVATGLRVVSTWLVSAGLVSIGRESAIVESGGAVGSMAGLRTGGRGDAMAASGIAAAFAAAYNAPFAAVFYVEEHLRVRQSTRASAFVVLGAVSGHLTTIWLFDGGAIFPDVDGSVWRVALDGLIVVVPVVIVSRIFFQLRVRVTAESVARATRCPAWVVVLALAVIAGLSVVAFPLASGNGMDALQRGPEDPTVTLAFALVVGKLVGTTAALGSGAPGGVLSPTLGVASGVALLVFIGLDDIGFAVDRPWEAMVAAMAVGVAVGMRSPLVAVFLIPELLGDYWLVLAVAPVVLAAVVLDRVVDRVVVRIGARVPTEVYDADA
jgi:CIC family chloride channel protein